jgi:hypothetical protein
MIGIRVFNFTKEVADSKLDCWHIAYSFVALKGESLSGCFAALTCSR